MANTKISALPAAAGLTGPEIIPAVQSGADVGATATQLQAFAQSGVQLWWPAPVSSNWYLPFPGLSAAAGGALPNGQLCLLPFILEQPMTVKALGARVTTLSATGSIGLAVYASAAVAGAGHRPTGNPLLSSAAIAPTSAIDVTSGALSPVSLQASTLYWGAVWADSVAAGTVVLQAAATASIWQGMMVGSASQAHLASGAATTGMFLTYATAWTSGSPTNPPWPTITGSSCVEVAPGSAGASTYGLVQLQAN